MKLIIRRAYFANYTFLWIKVNKVFRVQHHTIYICTCNSWKRCIRFHTYLFGKSQNYMCQNLQACYALSCSTDWLVSLTATASQIGIKVLLQSSSILLFWNNKSYYLWCLTILQNQHSIICIRNLVFILMI